MDEKLSFSENGSTLTAHLSLEIDHHTAKEVRERIDEQLFKLSPEVLELDFSELRFMDSSGIGLIIGRSELCERLGAELKIVSPSPRIKRLIRLSGIEKIKNITII